MKINKALFMLSIVITSPCIKLDSIDISYILSQPLEIQKQYFITILASVNTLKELKKEIGSFSLVSQGFKQIVDSKEGQDAIRNRYKEILKNVQTQLNPWIETARRNIKQIPNIAIDGIDAVTTAPGHKNYCMPGTTTLALLAGADDRDYSEPILLLIKNDASVNKSNASGTSPLMWAARFNNVRSAQLLLENGAKINQQDVDGYTALIRAVVEGYPDMVALLLDKGANRNIRTYQSKYPTSMLNAFEMARYYMENTKNKPEDRSKIYNRFESDALSEL